MSSFWTKEIDQQLAYLVDCGLTNYQMARILNTNSTSVAVRIFKLELRPRIKSRPEPWPPTKDYWTVQTWFEDVEPEILAREKKRSPGVIRAAKPSYADGHTVTGGTFALFCR